MLFFPKARVIFVPLTSDFSFLGTNLVKKAIYAMVEGDCDEVSCSRGAYPLFLCSGVVAIRFSAKVRRSLTSRCRHAWGSFNIPDVANAKSAF